jgi:hypothetical protein
MPPGSGSGLKTACFICNISSAYVFVIEGSAIPFWNPRDWAKNREQTIYVSDKGPKYHYLLAACTRNYLIYHF